MKNNKKGFTLVEVMVALSLILMMVAAVYPLMRSSMQGLTLASSQQTTLYSNKQQVENDLAEQNKVSTTDITVTLRDGSGTSLGNKQAAGNYFGSTDGDITTFKAGGDSLLVNPSQEEDQRSAKTYQLSIYGQSFTDATKFSLQKVNSQDQPEDAPYNASVVTFAVTGDETAEMKVKTQLTAGWYRISYEDLSVKLLIYSSEYQCKLMAVGENGTYAVMDPLKGSDWVSDQIKVTSGIASSTLNLLGVTFSKSDQKFYVAAENGYILTMDKFNRWAGTKMTGYTNAPDVTCIAVDDNTGTVYAAANYTHNASDANLSYTSLNNGANQTPLGKGGSYLNEVLFYNSALPQEERWAATNQWGKVYDMACANGVIAMSGETSAAVDQKQSVNANDVLCYSDRRSVWGMLLYYDTATDRFIRRVDENNRIYDTENPYWGLNKLNSICYLPNFTAKETASSSVAKKLSSFVVAGGSRSVYNCICTGEDTASGEPIGLINGHGVGDASSPMGVANIVYDDKDLTIMIDQNAKIYRFNNVDSWTSVSDVTYTYTYVDSKGNTVTKGPGSLSSVFGSVTINALTSFENRFYMVGSQGFIAWSDNGQNWTIIDTRLADGTDIKTNFNAIYGYTAVS